MSSIHIPFAADQRRGEEQGDPVSLPFSVHDNSLSEHSRANRYMPGGWGEIDKAGDFIHFTETPPPRVSHPPPRVLTCKDVMARGVHCSF